jgi:hypothetical protein
MISGSKSGFRIAFPERVAVFNAYVVTLQAQVLWNGDLCLTTDMPRLKALAKAIGKPVFVLNESAAPGFLGNELRYERAVLTVHPDGSIAVGSGLEPYVTRCNRGFYKGLLTYKPEFRREPTNTKRWRRPCVDADRAESNERAEELLDMLR